MTRLPPAPIAPFGRRAASVTAREEHGAYIVIRRRDAGGPRPRAGQFYMLTAGERWGGGEGERPFLPRAFCVLRAGDGELQFLIEDVGPGTRRLCELRPGDSLLLVGPLGNGFAPPREARAPLLVGGGVGIAPLAIWQDELGGAASTLLGFRDAAHAARRRAPHKHRRRHRRRQRRPPRPRHGAARGRTRRPRRDVEVYACGPPAMLEAVRELCSDREVPAQLALESGMACGFGACFGCVVPTTDGYVRLCVDGPVLDSAKLRTALAAGASH